MDDKVLSAFILASKHAFAHAFKIVYLTTLAFTGVGIIVAFFITDEKEHLTDYVNKNIHKRKKRKEDSG